MELNSLTAISPIDGRYRNRTEKLSEYFSEYALIKYRLKVECEYVYFLCNEVIKHHTNKDVSKIDKETLENIYNNFNMKDAQKVKDYEKVTNHDVKSVEYFLKDKFTELGWKEEKEWIHFGLTSQDINNVAIPLALKDFLEIYYKELEKLISKIKEISQPWMNIPMLSRTHGQPATPTRVGKEFYVWVDRLNKQLELLKKVPMSGKFGGATGQFNAHLVAFPKVKWTELGDKFLSELGLVREKWTTQISNYDNLAALLDGVKRINVILLDLCKDVWHYISLNYFLQKININEVGSSAMPHKVNPIDFENAEGNLGLANSIFEYLSSKLPVSRLQRDLTDSTTLRNLGVPFAHTLISFSSIIRGLDKIVLNKDQINKDLEENFIVISEAIQTILRREGFENPYEMVKSFTRTGESLNEEKFKEFVLNLGVSNDIKKELLEITPFNFIGQLPDLFE